MGEEAGREVGSGVGGGGGGEEERLKERKPRFLKTATGFLWTQFKHDQWAVFQLRNSRAFHHEDQFRAI